MELFVVMYACHYDPADADVECVFSSRELAEQCVALQNEPKNFTVKAITLNEYASWLIKPSELRK